MNCTKATSLGYMIRKRKILVKTKMVECCCNIQATFSFSFSLSIFFFWVFFYGPFTLKFFWCFCIRFDRV